MPKGKSRQKRTERKSTGLVPTGEPPAMDEADGVRVGEEPVPGMRLRCICRGHTEPIGRIAWSPCGRFIASPSQDGTVRIWDANNGKCLAVLEADGWVQCVKWSPDGAILASGEKGHLIHLYDVSSISRRTGDEPKTTVLLRTLTHAGAGRAAPAAVVVSLSWSHDQKVLASSSNIDDDIRLWNPSTGLLLRKLSGHHPPINSVAWSLNNIHYCPVKSRIESAGWGHRVSCRGSRTAAKPVKWAFSRIG